ncbi:Transposase IS200 like protein [Posidoniimonas polymericola]|uniref:Transposase IS200 like protein n=1 Tax=Posidoniimonas polymericola TaxID=2528002 RepID=A0A5C5Y0E8_9BACT|nr:IS200/IS605 family transposase [Posidoniimonas polymericola]TWT67715.1 Transposase IS200 like protein [Posidoniimonas polymericola]
MAQSLSNVLVHLVFSTKHRRAWIDQGIEAEMHAYLAKACRSMGAPAIKVGGVDDHVHLACRLGRTVSVADLVQGIKQDSSKWVKTRGETYQAFAWQNGYGAFSVGASQLPALVRYIEGQREHHRQASFQEEYRTLLERYGIEFDERYVWE